MIITHFLKKINTFFKNVLTKTQKYGNIIVSIAKHLLSGALCIHERMCL